MRRGRLTPRRALVAAGVAAQLVVMLAWGTVLGRPWTPDGGLRQIDLLLLDEPAAAPGAALGPVPGPTLVAARAPGACDRQADEADGRYGTSRGLPADVTLVLLADDAPGRERAAALGLRAADGGCTPGYALLAPGADADDPARLRYRTLDPGWAAHSDEQRVLLGWLRREQG